MTWLMRPDGTFIYASQRWRAYTGITKEEVTEQDWVVLLHPEDRDRMLAEIGGPFGRGEPHEARFRLQRHDGVHRWVLARAEPLRDPAGRVVEWVGTTVDIHDMLEAQATQAESEARLKLAVEGAGAGVWELDVRRGAWRLDRCAVALTGAQCRRTPGFRTTRRRRRPGSLLSTRTTYPCGTRPMRRSAAVRANATTSSTGCRAATEAGAGLRSRPWSSSATRGRMRPSAWSAWRAT
jgi:PAS domain S-box-containing protein